MAVNKVVFGDQTIMDITDTTATAGTIVQGYTAYGANGVKLTGTFDPSIYVKKSGDTMTGSLNLNGNSAFITTHIKNIDTSQPNQYDYSEEAYSLFDTGTVKMGSIGGKLNTDGKYGIAIGTHKAISGTLYENKVNLLMDGSGNSAVEITQPASWRNALGLGDTSGALPIANGGTGATTKANAKTALDIDDLENKVGSFMTTTKTISANSSGSFTFDGFCSFCILISGSVVGVRCILMGHCSTAGNVVVSKISFGSDSITTSTSTNKLTITNGASQAGYARFIRVSSSGTMPT